MKKKEIIWMLLACVAMLVSCSSRDKETTGVAQKHASWIASLEDSVKFVQNEIQRINTEIDHNQADVDSLLSMFDVIDNPRYVEKYSVCKGWSNYDTGAKTGVLVRMCENGMLEMIATLQGGFFDRVSIECAGQSLSTSVVPYDKALNYRIGSTNIVAFKGKEVDEICRMVSENETAELKMTFIGEKPKKTIVLTPTQKEMIATTFRLWNCVNTVNRDNMQLQLLSEKMRIFETHIQKSNPQDSVK